MSEHCFVNLFGMIAAKKTPYTFTLHVSLSSGDDQHIKSIAHALMSLFPKKSRLDEKQTFIHIPFNFWDEEISN